jgi:hypothetical protein
MVMTPESPAQSLDTIQSQFYPCTTLTTYLSIPVAPTWNLEKSASVKSFVSLQFLNLNYYYYYYLFKLQMGFYRAAGA